jgi:3-deoxy-D-manno-octulosonic-acid transferase
MEAAVREKAFELAYEVAAAAALAAALPALPWLWYRGYTDGLSQRLGAVAPPPGGFAERPLWLHAASVGETLAALPLVEALRGRHPQVPWVVSNTTVTGRAVAQREIAPAVSTLLPVDALRIVDRALARLRPRALIVVEGEIWPGLLRAADRAGAAIVVVSAQLSERSLRRSLWARPLFAAALRRVDALCAQSEEDARRLRRLGAAAERLHVTGNLKAGRAAVGAAALPIALGERPVLVAASTQPGEEELVLAAAERLWVDRPEMLLVLAPRRPQRFDEVAAILRRRGVPAQRRSAGDAAVREESRVLLLDTLGELAAFYGAARAVFVGGTIAPLGGHNVLEPAAAGVAVSFGPSLDNVGAAAAALRAAAAGVEVADAEALAGHWAEMLARPERAHEAGRRARQVAAELAGAVDATLRVIEPLLALPGEPLLALPGAGRRRGAAAAARIEP